MSGGGGGYYSYSGGRSSSPSDETGDSDENYPARVENLLKDALKEINDRDVDATRRHIEELERVLETEFDGSVELRFGGSVEKHTYVDGLSDVDMLLFLEADEARDLNPEEAKEIVREKLANRFPENQVEKGKMAVTIHYSDGHEIQVLPAYQTETGVKISTAEGTEWSSVVRPHRFAEKLQEVNKANGGGVVPTIKLFKAVQDENISKDSRLKGYHVESLAIEAFRDYDGSRTRRAMLTHLFQEATDRVKRPIEDRSGQSLHVDEYLGPPGSSDREEAARKLRQIARSMEKAERREHFEDWEALLGGE